MLYTREDKINGIEYIYDKITFEGLKEWMSENSSAWKEAHFTQFG